MSDYKKLRSQLDEILEELESVETSDIDRIIALHTEALELVDKLEKELERAAKSVKKPKT